MSKPRVFVTRILPAAGLDRITQFCDADIWPGDLPPSREELLARVSGMDGLVTLLSDPISAAVMDGAGPQLKVISQYAVGFDNIDIPAATARGIRVGHTPGILTDATADFAFALLMSAARRVVEADRHTREGKWKTWGPSILLGSDFVGATLGLVGFGRIGRAMAKRASGFDMRVIYYDPTAQPDPAVQAEPVDSLEDLLRQSDFVSLHTPLTAQTRGMINAQTLGMMKPNAVLVNTSRGQVIDQPALYAALQSGQIFAAALDVTDPEPLPLDSPLLTLPNLIIAPHIASASTRTREQMAVLTAENLIAGLKGEPLPRCVNP
ncbi:MAG TPA: D-glycerate dehydrogenase [Anaerolineaceae bacterium]